MIAKLVEFTRNQRTPLQMESVLNKELVDKELDKVIHTESSVNGKTTLALYMSKGSGVKAKVFRGRASDIAKGIGEFAKKADIVHVTQGANAKSSLLFHIVFYQ